MEPHPLPRILFTTLLLFAAPACGGGGSPTDLPDTDHVPRAELAAPSLAAVGVPVILNGSDSQGAGLAYRFAFGDGARVEGANAFASHVYAQPGAYAISLRVTDAGGRVSTASRSVEVVAAPVAGLTFRLPTEGGMPRLWDLPFPNDLHRNEAGHVVVTRQDLEQELGSLGPRILSKGLGFLDGFGLTTAVYVPLTSPPLDASLPATAEASRQPGSSVFLLDMDAGSPERGARHPVDVHYDARTQRLAVLPAGGHPLEPGRRYAVVLTSGLVSAAGPYALPADFAALRAGTSGNAAAAELYAPLWPLLAEAPDLPDRDAIAVATVFTTQSTLRDLLRIRAYLEDVPPGGAEFTDPGTGRLYTTAAALDALLGVPEENRAGRDNPGGVAHQHMAAIGLGTFPALEFRTARDGVFAFDGQGHPVPQGQADIPFAIVVPNHPPPPDGYPVVIVQHGIGSSRDYVVVLANDLAAAGFVSVGIDAAEHGARFFQAADERNNFSGEPLEGGDGFADYNPNVRLLGFFEAFLSIHAIRENFRQTVADQMQLVRLLRSSTLDLSPVGSPPLDPERIYYLGDSLGAIMGTAFLATEPDLSAGVLNVAGGGLLNDLFINSPGQFGGNVDVLRALLGIPEEDPIDRFSLVVNLAQAIVDGADSVNYAPWIFLRPPDGPAGPTAPREVLMTEVVGDEDMPNVSSEVLARAMGLELLAPYLIPVDGVGIVPSPAARNVSTPGGPVTAAMVQYSPATHGANLQNQYGPMRFYPGFPFPFGPSGERFPPLPEAFQIPQPNVQTLAQITHFFRRHRDTGHGEILSIQPPVPDFDADGILDADDPDPLNPDVPGEGFRTPPSTGTER